MVDQSDVNTNVVLTADNSQYDQAFMASAGKTDQLTSSIDTLTSKLDKLSKSAGRKLVGVGAVDTASIVAATAAYAAFEKQMTSLNTQAATLARTNAQASNQMRQYRGDVDQLRRSFALSTSDAAQLEQTVVRMSDNTTSIDKLTKTFANMGAATQESSTQLASSMLQLTKSMGNPMRDADRYANQMTVLSKRVNTTADALTQFSQSIAPVGRLANISQTDLMGFSAAFAKAGQDGYQAANVFTKMLSDISYASQTGSPELNKYANLVGMTVDNFKQLGGTDQFLKIFEAINRQGPQAITTLNRMGLDGARTVRTVTAMAQSGGLASEINAARNADPAAMKQGAHTAMDEIATDAKKLRIELTQTAEAIGSVFAGPAKVFLGTLTLIAGGIREVAESPLGKIVAVVAAAAAPFVALAGAILLSAKALATFSTAAYLLRGAPALGFRDARAGAVSRAGENALEGSWTNRMFYQGGAGLGRFIRRGEGPGMMSRAAGWGLYGAGGAARFLGSTVYGPGSTRIPGIGGTGGFDDVSRRANFFGANRVSESFAGAGPFLSSIRGGLVDHGITAFGGGFRNRGMFNGATSYDDAYAMNKRFDQLSKSRTGGLTSTTEKMAQAEADVQRVSATARAMGEVEKSSMSLSRGMSGLGRGIGNLVGMIGTTGISAGRTAGGFLGRAAGGLGLNPYMAGALGLFGTYEGLKSLNNDAQVHITDTSGFTSQYAKAGGITPIPTAQLRSQQAAQSGHLTLAQARNISRSDVSASKSQGFQLTNTDLKGLSKTQAQARLAQDWPYIMNNPAAVNAAAQDLASLFPRGDAQEIMNNLMSGNITGDLNTFATTAAHPGKTGFWGHVFNQQSGSKADKNLSQLFGGIGDRTNYLAATQGNLAASRYQGGAYNQAIQSFTGAKNYNPHDSVLSANFSASLLNQLFNTKLTTGEASTMYLGKNQDLRGFLNQAIAAPGAPLRGKDLESALGTYPGLDTNLKGSKAVDALVNAILHPSKDVEDMSKDINSAANRIERMSSAVFGVGGVLGLASVSKALTGGSEDINAQYKASQEVADSIAGSGKGLRGQQSMINRLMSTAGGVQAAGSDIFAGAAQLLNRNLGFQMPYMNRTQQFSAQTANIKAAETTPLSAGFTREQQMQQEDYYAQQVQNQYDYFKQMLYQQREFDVQRTRAEEDYSLQRSYAFEDFDRMRNRAEADFNISRNRAEADFARNMKRNRADFNLSRKRQEEDYNHQVKVMVEQQAKQMYNIYDRVQVQRTSSASWLLVNAQDQLKRMNTQESDLSKLRKMGLSKDAIQQMGFNDPANQQQLTRFVTEAGQNPNLIKSFNAAITKRLQAAKKLVTDDSSMEWEEFNRSYKLARDRAQADFEKSVKRARQDFTRSLHEQNQDFQRSLSRQQQDFAIGMDRQATAYKTAMDRSAADLARSAKTIDGNFEDILTMATKRLSGHAKTQADTVLAEFTNLKNSTDPAAKVIMRSLAAIFGVKYQAPKNLPTMPGGPHIRPENQFAGGVLPGYSPGVDNMKFKSDQGHELNLSGGEAIMVPEWTKAVGGIGAVHEMNRRARGHKFASGGVFQNPDRRVYMDGEPVSAISAAQIMLAERLSHKDFRTIQGSWQPYSSYSGSSHMGPGVVDEAPGNFNTQYWLRRVGFAAWGRNFPGAATAGSGAHVHAVSRLDPGAAHQGQLAQFAAGGDGLGGKDYGPNPSVLPGIGAMLAQFGDLVLSNGGPGGAPLIPSWSSIAKDRYPAVERAVEALSAVQVFKKNQMSSIINTMGKKAYDRMRQKYGDSIVSGVGGVGGGGGSAIDATGSNRSIVHQYANQFGWGSEWNDLVSLVNAESGFNNTAQNPHSSAYGMFQFLNSTWNDVGGHKTSDPNLQALYGMRYIKQNYGDPSKAWDFHQAHGWYKNGGVFQGPQTIGVGESGPEMVLPLNDRGTQFIVDLMKKTMVGLEGRGTNLTGSVPKMWGGMSHVYNLDRSTNFTGPITVQAQNPAELIHQLRQRSLVTALSQASLGGARI